MREPGKLPQLLIDTDWGEEWKKVQRARKHVDCSEKWDKRAPSFGDSLAPTSYVWRFIELLDLQEGDTVFDMGCGNGAIAVPLAQAGYHVVARDFSAGMLAGLTAAAERAQVVDFVDAAQMSWEDDWEACGVLPGSVDVAFASRSLITQDLAASLAKLTAVARRHACVTASSGFTPMMSPTILHELGVTTVRAYDDQYVFNILKQMGYYPTVRYIVQDREFSFDTPDQVKEDLLASLEHARTYCDEGELDAAVTRVEQWVEGRIQPNEKAGQPNHHGGVEGAFKLVVPNDIRWTHIKWEV